MKSIARALCLLALTWAGVYAQNVAGTSSLSGVVQDVTGAVVPGATVVVENASKGIRRELTTTEGGVFNAPSLVPAPGYSVTVTKEGFAAFNAKDINLEVGQTINLAPRLQVSGSATTVSVSSEVPLIETSKPNVSEEVTQRQIQDLPINGRRVDSFVLLTPAVVPDAAFGLLSFRGLPGGNTFLTDGVDTTNQYYDENAGRTRTFNISQDAVQEFQVITSGSLAEFGRASGGVVNTITRSGTNDYHGTAYWFFRNRTLNATDITTGGVNPQDWRHQAGASIGGPIKKDKLFFFFNGELQRRYFPIYSANIANNLFNNTTSIVPNACGAPATPAQCAAAQAYVTSRAAPQLIPRSSDVNLMFGKIDYQINSNNRATFELNYVDFRSPNGIQTQLALVNGNAIGNNANTTVFDRTAKAGLTSILSPNMVNQINFGFFKDRQYDLASASLLPSIGPIALSFSGAYSLSYLGYATSYPRLNPSEQRTQIGDTLSYTVGNHSLKFGGNFANIEDYAKSLSNQYGSYTYSDTTVNGVNVSSLTNFALDFTSPTATKHWKTYSQKFGNPIVDTTLQEVDAFVQDEWHVTPKLTISPGVRYELTLLPQPSLTNPAVPATTRIPQTTLDFAPRFGIAYAVNQKTVIRGDFGMFYNRYVSSVISNFFSTNGLYQKTFTLSSTGAAGAAQVAAGPNFPNFFAQSNAPTAVNGSASLAFADQGFRNSYSEQASASIERQLTSTSSLTASYIWDRGLHLTSAYDANAAAPTSTATYQILNSAGAVVSNYTTPIYTSRIIPAFGAIIAETSSNNSYYSGLAVQYRKRYANWFQSQVSYTYSHAIDYNIGGGANTLYTSSYPTSVFNGNYSGEKGSSSNDQRHRLTANAVFSPRFTSSNSFFAKFFVNNWQLSALTIAASAQPLVPTVSVGAAPSGLLSSSTLNGLGGSTRVPFQSISALNSDELYRTDARLSKILPFTERFRVTLMFEAFNVFNHPYFSGSSPRNSTEYTTRAVTSGGVTSYQLVPNALYGQWLQTTAVPDGTTARRAQVAIRIEF